jgi:hypothetical protein
LAQAKKQVGSQVDARESLRQAQDLVDSLAAQLRDPVLKDSFQKSSLFR